MNLMVGLITGAFGLGYFIYGRKQTKMIFLATGIVLMIYPYLLSNIVALTIAGVILLLLPFMFKQ